MPVQLRYQREATYLVWIIPQLKKKHWFFNQQVIHLAKEEKDSQVCTLSGDTDEFVFWVNLFSRDQIQSSVTMESPIHGRSSLDTNGTARPQCAVIPVRLPCLSMQELDSVEATYGLGKTNAIMVARRGYKLDLLGQPMADITKVVKEATIFIAA